MSPLIEQNREAIASLCRRFDVAKLELFGSALRPDFDVKTSDVDLVVDFHPLDPLAFGRAYFGLMESLQSLLDRPIDLVCRRSITNPYFRNEIQETAQPLYAA
jgi:predicted nucleotidyltransferase